MNSWGLDRRIVSAVDAVVAIIGGREAEYTKAAELIRLGEGSQKKGGGGEFYFEDMNGKGGRGRGRGLNEPDAQSPLWNPHRIHLQLRACWPSIQ